MCKRRTTVRAIKATGNLSNYATVYRFSSSFRDSITFLDLHFAHRIDTASPSRRDGDMLSELNAMFSVFAPIDVTLKYETIISYIIKLTLSIVLILFIAVSNVL